MAVLASLLNQPLVLHHVDHGLREGSDREVQVVADLATALKAAFVSHTVTIAAGPNLEARARDARFSVLPSGVATGHTADDRAATVVINLLRGAGSRGLSSLREGHHHPILALRRSEAVGLCQELNLTCVIDPTNTSSDFLRNQVRMELLPHMENLANRDIVVLLNRSAMLLGEEDAYLDELALEAIPDPTDLVALQKAPSVLVARRLRNYLTFNGYAPSVAELSRVLQVVRGEVLACEVAGGRRVTRAARHLVVT